MNSHSPGKRTGTFLSVIAVLALNIGIIAPTAVLGAGGNPSASLAQCANDPAPSSHLDGCSASANDWVNGNVGSSKANYSEGDSLPYRLLMDNLSLTPAPHTVIIEWDTTKGGTHALDYLTTFNRTVATANPCLGVSGCTFPGVLNTNFTQFPIPADPQWNGTGAQTSGNFTLFGGTITGISAYSGGATFPVGDNSRRIAITFTATNANPVLAWGGHIAARLNWGAGGSAVAISGSPYHTRLVSLDGSGGNQDRSLSADSVTFPGFIHIVKNTLPSGQDGTFNFTASPAPLSNFAITTASGTGSKNFDDITNFTAYPVAETVPSGWGFTSLSCAVASPNGGTQPVTGSSVTINLKEGEQVTCTYTNTKQNPHLTIDKVATESGFNAVGQVIHYTITATNDGNTTLAAVTVTDPNATGLSCTPANGSPLAPTATMTCTASHTITQANIDTGSYYNQACVDDGTGGAASQCDDVTTPGTKNPHLTIDKVATESGFNAVGQVIHYTITATNDGNTTLAAVTVTDPNATGLSCTPANGSPLAPTATMTCTASHTITQANIDTGSYYNQACVDDGTGGAASQCDDVTTPGTKNPHLTIDKVATESGFNAVGQVIHYTITATNDGNTTLAAVTVTDPNATGLSCTPANGSPLAPTATMTCTASHTITQANIDTGSYYNQACVDDGTGGAASQCDDVTTPGTKNPHLTIDKVATESGFNAVGQVIHYTITATNDGNTTLAAVTVTDPNATGLSCTPANGSPLAPTATMTCTASHTITQANIDTGSYYNQACVDDGTGGAASQCDDVTTPGTKNPALSIVKDVTETSYDSIGDILHYSITATNSGNTTLAAVTITDTEAVLGTCTPANGSSRAPGQTLTCEATHTITQTDIDAGAYNNTACVDDGAGGATQKCDDADVDADQNPSLSIVKTDLSTTKYEDVGDVIQYSIVARNTGNTTLAAVTVTDADAVLGTCTPVNGSALAPNATMTCPASHTITQADITAGSYKNTACVDDGAGGAAQACDDVTTPGKAQPSVATTDTFIPQDSIIMSGLTGVADGDLYVELRINQTCGQAGAPAYSRTWSGSITPISNTTPYVTTNAVAVSTDATVRWCVSYSGDDDNANIPLGSHGEISSIDFDPSGVLGFGAGFAIPLLLLGFWNRKRRQSEA